MFKNRKETIIRIATIGVGLTVLIMPDCYAADKIAKSLSKIDSLGKNGLRIIQYISFWVIVIKGGSDILKAALEGNLQGCGKVVVQYVCIYALIFLFPLILEMVKDAF